MSNTTAKALKSPGAIADNGPVSILHSSYDRPAFPLRGPVALTRPTDTPHRLQSGVMTARIVQTADPTETEALGAELAAGLQTGDTVLVMGELGSGKTTFVRGAARALGVTDPVTSPTFSIGHRYRGAGVTVSHLDLYRLQSLAHEDPELLADYFGPDRIAFVEWPQAGAGELAQARLRVTLHHAGGETRRIEVDELAAGADRHVNVEVAETTNT
jgi:tRNA threonylcarbamoyladenosine biosynthesis protein TsaE